MADNPFKNAKIEYWPDYWLVVAGIGFLIVLGAYVASRLTPAWLILFGGLFLFGIGGKIAHYRKRDPALGANAWFSKWRHGFLSDTFAAFGSVMILAAVVMFFQS